jgi:anti-sigma B factor antagonist
MDLTISERVADGVKVLELSGTIKLGETANYLRGRLKEALADGDAQLVLDFSRVVYVDSAGLGALVACCTTARNGGGNVKLARLGQQFRDLLYVTKLLGVFDVYASLEEAVQSFEQAG